MIQVTTATKKLLTLKKRIKAICGGTSASKTFSIIMILIDKAQSNRNKRIDIMSESYPHLEGGAIQDFKQIMMERGYWVDSRWNESKHIYTFETGSVIKFISVDKLGKAHGPRRDILFINEAPNIPYNIYDQLEIRTKEEVWLDWNPTNEFWYYTQIKDKIDHDFETLTYKDNEALDERIIHSIEAKKGNKQWWQVYGLGQLGEVEGKIYKDWNIVDEIPHEARLERYGLDFGYSNDPTVIVAIYYYNGGFIIDEIAYQKELSNKSIADIFNNLEKALVIADSAEPKSIDEVKSYGVNIIGAEKGQGSVLKGIQYVQAQRISLTSRSLKTIKAYRNFLWKIDKRTGEILNEPDDAIHEWSNPMDAIRYGLDSFRPREQNDEDLNLFTNYY